MSVEDLKKYGKMCAEDDKLRAEAKKIGIDNIDGQIAHAKSLGLDFSAEDLQALSKEMGGEGELSEEDLEAVSGGFVTALAAAVVGAAAGVVGAGAAVTSTTGGSGW
jgi:predicted ribosomally synthesized peptide with nif11-like leader